MQKYLLVFLILFFSILILYQVASSMNIIEGLENGNTDATTTTPSPSPFPSPSPSPSSGCDCSQVYKNVGNITTLQNDVKKNSSDIIDLQSSVKAILSTGKK